MSNYQPQPDRVSDSGWQILSIAGVPFFVKPSFLVFIGIIILYTIQTQNSIPQAGLLGFIIFFSLLGHEGGHAMMARLLGYRDISVSLVMLGGNTHHPPATRGHSLMIALAGPLVTLAMAGLAFALLYWSHSFAFMALPASKHLAWMICLLNLVWLVFNLLPIYPMDGGQALFYLLSFLLSEKTALLSTAVVSMLTCLGAGYYAVNLGYMLACLFLLTFFVQNLQLARMIGSR
jgi:stage IV sporulation protein FB